ncbi:MFS transporter [Bacillus paralicheniformis]|jgi:sugar phosphate permease|uniref:MFS transporter n=1 Tax=Bacillus paralicheniformis TaxID=1648923 RepID=UPI000342420C|nr:MFS transporter [Bacillus paralicheniformis]KJD55720.1 MFS transporter [Bacillus amyloliquefaciens]KUL14321.1 MFS transporter [Bacillus licheniformis LMG 7559]AGN38650.1 putative permease YybO [Bacillus paralicheniformis ATCC 9945a]AYQ18675.1 MFS transporter [Bacillus paralicheniformis]MCR3888467.1 MFS transporter [Bacillus paralicheniformis]
MAQELEKRPGHTRWYISSLLSSMIILNYFDRVAISVAAPAIQDSFQLTATQLGIVFSIYTYSYTLMQIPVGSLLDKYGVAWVTRVGMTVWSFLTIILAFLQGKLLLYIVRFLIGLTSASAFPAASKATALWFPQNERGLANSLFDSAAKFANVIGAPLVAFLVTTFDWRAAFLTIGIINVLFTVFFWMYYEQPDRHKRISKEELHYIQKHNAVSEEDISERTLIALKAMLANRKAWGLMIGFTGYGYTFNLPLTWLPTFFKETYGMDIMSSGLFTAVPWLISTISGIVVGGWLVDFLIQKGHSNTKVYQTIIAIGMSLGFAFLGAVFTHNITIAIICISVGLAGISATAPVGWSISADIAPAGSISLLSSMVNLANNLFGGIIAVSLTGYLVDVTGSFTLSFLVAGFVLLLGLVFYLAVLGDIKRIQIDKQET